MVLPASPPDWESCRETIPQSARLATPLWEATCSLLRQPRADEEREFKQKQAAGPLGVLTIFPRSTWEEPGSAVRLLPRRQLLPGVLVDAGDSRRFGFHARLSFRGHSRFHDVSGAMIPHAIWFRCRIVGHVIESIAFAAITARSSPRCRAHGDRAAGREGCRVAFCGENEGNATIRRVSSRDLCHSAVDGRKPGPEFSAVHSSPC